MFIALIFYHKFRNNTIERLKKVLFIRKRGGRQASKNETTEICKYIFKKDLTNKKKIDIIIRQTTEPQSVFMEKYSSGEEAPLLRV